MPKVSRGGPQPSIDEFVAAGNSLDGGQPNGRSTYTIAFKGSGSTLILGDGALLRNVRFVFPEGGGTVAIGANAKVFDTEFRVRGGSKVVIQDRVSMRKPCTFIAHERTTITIGADSAISDCTFRSSDMHAILDLATGSRINPGADIVVGEHVWLAEGVIVLKGVTIGNNSVVGARSVVSKSIPANCVAVGTPARVVREGVTWRKSLTDDPAGEIADD